MPYTAQELARLDRMLAHFSKKQELYIEYHQVCEKVCYYGPGASKFPFILLFPVTGITSFVMLLCCLMEKFGDAAITFATSTVPVFLLVGGGLLLHRKNRQNYRMCCDRYLELAQALSAHYQDFGPCPLSPGYTDPQTLAAIRGCLERRQAATIADSLGRILSVPSYNALVLHISKLSHYTSHLPQLPVFYPGRFFSADPREIRDFPKHTL